MTLSAPVKVIALAALALVIGAGGFLMLARKHDQPATVAQTPPAKVVTVSVSATHHAAKPSKPKLQLDPSLPSAVRERLMHSKKVVVYVYTGLAASDRAEGASVRAGAHDAHVPFVALDVTHETIADQVFAWTSSTDDPSVLVVKRPGTIAFQVTGLTDRQTVAQAAAAAR